MKFDADTCEVELVVKVHLLGAPASNVPRRGTVETINGRYEFEYKISKNGVFDARAR